MVGVAGVETLLFGGFDFSDTGFDFVAIFGGHVDPSRFVNPSVSICITSMSRCRVDQYVSLVGSGWVASTPNPPACDYLPDAPLLDAISTSAVAWMRANSSLSKPGENSSRRSGATVIGNPSGMTAVLSSVPSFDGDAPR